MRAGAQVSNFLIGKKTRGFLDNSLYEKHGIFRGNLANQMIMCTGSSNRVESLELYFWADPVHTAVVLLHMNSLIVVHERMSYKYIDVYSTG